MRNTIIGFYGKIPSHKDFIHSNLPRAFIDTWDPWLQNLFSYWRNELSDDWVADYLTMSPYRFILSRGIAGEVNWFGVMVPSRDYAGRLFPLTICIPLTSKLSPLSVLRYQGGWLNKIENMAIQCLKPSFDPESVHNTFIENLVNIGLPNIFSATNSKLSHILPADLLHEISCSQQDILSSQKQFSFALHDSKTSYQPLAESLLNEYCHAYSLWWSKNEDTVLYSQGLPHKSISPAFIDKQWEKWGWLSNRLNNGSKILSEDDTQTFN